MAKAPTYTQEGKALKDIAEQIIDPIVRQYGGNVQDALTETRKKIRLNKATIREVAFVSLQEKGISISKEFADNETGAYYDDFKLFKDHFPEIKGGKAPIAGSLTGGNSPSAAEFKSGMNSFIKTHVNMSPEQLKAGKVPIGITGLDTPYRQFNTAVSQNREQFFITSKGERSNKKAADRTFLGYLTSSLSKVVNEGKETGPDGNEILVRTDDLTAGYRGQGRVGKGFDKGLTAKSFVKMIQETISEIDKLPDVSDSDKANAKIYTLLNSYIPSRPKAFKDMMTSKPSKDSDFANRPYFEMSDGKGYLMFPEGYGGGTKSYVSTELPNNITNIFLTIQNQKQGAGEAVPMLFDKNFTATKLNKILLKTLGEVTSKPEYTTVLGKQAPAKSMAAFRKLTAGAMSRSLNLPDLSGRELHEFVLAHGVDAKGEAYTKQMHGQTQGSILNAFQHILASESGLDNLGKLNAYLGFDPVTVSSGAFEKVDTSIARTAIDNISTSTIEDAEVIPDREVPVGQVIDNVVKEQANLANQRRRKHNLLQYLDSLLPKDSSGQSIFVDEEAKLKFLNYFDNKDQLNTFLYENVFDLEDNSLFFKKYGKIPDNFNVIDVSNLFQKAESIRSRTVPDSGIDLTQEGIRKKGSLVSQLLKSKKIVPFLAGSISPHLLLADYATVEAGSLALEEARDYFDPELSELRENLGGLERIDPTKYDDPYFERAEEEALLGVDDDPDFRFGIDSEERFDELDQLRSLGLPVQEYAFTDEPRSLEEYRGHMGDIPRISDETYDAEKEELATQITGIEGFGPKLQNIRGDEDRFLAEAQDAAEQGRLSNVQEEYLNKIQDKYGRGTERALKLQREGDQFAELGDFKTLAEEQEDKSQRALNTNQQMKQLFDLPT